MVFGPRQLGLGLSPSGLYKCVIVLQWGSLDLFNEISIGIFWGLGGDSKQPYVVKPRLETVLGGKVYGCTAPSFIISCTQAVFAILCGTKTSIFFGTSQNKCSLSKCGNTSKFS